MKLVYLVLIGIFVGRCQACKDDQVQKTESSVVISAANFAEKILIIEHDVTDLTALVDLKYSATYMEMFEHPELYYDEALNFISENGHTLQQKQIAAYAMSNLYIEKYLGMVTATYDALIKGNVPEELLAQMVYYQYPLPSNKIVQNYKNDDVRKLLVKMQTGNFVSENFKRVIDKILSGKLLEAHKATM